MDEASASAGEVAAPKAPGRRRTGAVFLRVGLALALGGLLHTGSLTLSSTEYLHPSRWIAEYPGGPSDFEEVRVWGWPLYWIVDDPYTGVRGEPDLPAEIDPQRLTQNWLFWSLAVAWVTALAARTGRRGRTPRPPPARLFAAALLAPLTTFWVAVASLPFILHPAGSEPDLWRTFYDAGTLAVYATAAVYAVMAFFGLPIAFALVRKDRFRLRLVMFLGALLGVLPFLPSFLRELARSRPGDVLPGFFWSFAFLTTLALCGLLTAAVFWHLSTRLPRG